MFLPEKKSSNKKGISMAKSDRSVQRGKPLDKDCYKAHISKHEYGKDDNRCFCCQGGT